MALIIAEAGSNHHAAERPVRLKRALQCVDEAATRGADIVKFQLFIHFELLFCPMPGDDERWLRWRKTILRFEDWQEVKAHAEDKGIELMLSAFQPTGVQWVNKLGLRHKVASRAAEKYPYPDAEGELIISCGAVLPLVKANRLKCIMKYPAPLSESVWNDQYDGLSDHSGTPWPAIDALARGAEIVEVHFRPPGFDEGPDASVELEGHQLRMITEARDAFSQMRAD